MVNVARRQCLNWSELLTIENKWLAGDRHGERKAPAGVIRGRGPLQDVGDTMWGALENVRRNEDEANAGRNLSKIEHTDLEFESINSRRNPARSKHLQDRILNQWLAGAQKVDATRSANR